MRRSFFPNASLSLLAVALCSSCSWAQGPSFDSRPLFFLNAPNPISERGYLRARFDSFAKAWQVSAPSFGMSVWTGEQPVIEDAFDVEHLTRSARAQAFSADLLLSFSAHDLDLISPSFGTLPALLFEARQNVLRVIPRAIFDPPARIERSGRAALTRLTGYDPEGFARFETRAYAQDRRLALLLAVWRKDDASGARAASSFFASFWLEERP